MRYRSIFIISSIIFFLLTNCEKEAEIMPKEYPYVITTAPVVNADGATFSAELINLGTQKILKYGFVWSEHSKPTILDNIKLYENDAKKGIYSYKLNSGLTKGQSYNVRAYIKTEQYEVYGNNMSFTSLGSLPPEISSFSPGFGPIGTQVEINGENFSPSIYGNVVKFGNSTAIIDSASENKLVVSVPEIIKSEKVNISIETAGMSTTSTELFDLWFPWLQKNDFGSIGTNAASFSTQENGYVINANSTNILMYLPESDTWQDIGILPENSGNTPLAFVSQGNCYALLENNFWEYNFLIKTWIQKAEFPGIMQSDRRYIFGMSINGNIYIGNCYKSYEFWEYEIEIDSWQRKADFIGDFYTGLPVCGNFSFSVRNKGYLGVSQTSFAINTLWEYNPVQNSWSGKSPLPSNAYSGYCSFVINDDAYVGLGRNFNWGEGYVANDIWKYDSQDDVWGRYHNCPVRMGVNASFTIIDKGYIVSGHTEYYHDLDNVWEFDPLKN